MDPKPQRGGKVDNNLDKNVDNTFDNNNNDDNNNQNKTMISLWKINKYLSKTFLGIFEIFPISAVITICTPQEFSDFPYVGFLKKNTALPTIILQSSSSCRWTEGSSTPCPCQAMPCLTGSQCTPILICTGNQTIYSSFFKLLYCYNQSNLL